MQLRCISITIKNLVNFLLIISLAFQTSYSQQKESIPEFGNFPIIDSESDTSEEDIKQGSDDWIPNTSSFSITFDGNVDRILPKLSSPQEVVDHVIKTGVIENLETEELEKISDKYNNNNYNTNDHQNRNTEQNDSERFSSFNQRNRWSQVLKHLLELYKQNSGGILAKRGEGPQLSIVNPLDVLRQRLLLELARRRMKENQEQIQANAEILKKIGKRSIRSSETIPQQTVRSGETSKQGLITAENTSKNRYLGETGIDSRFLNIKKSLNKCQKCRRKKM